MIELGLGLDLRRREDGGTVDDGTVDGGRWAVGGGRRGCKDSGHARVRRNGTNVVAPRVSHRCIQPSGHTESKVGSQKRGVGRGTKSTVGSPVPPYFFLNGSLGNILRRRRR